MKIPLKTLSVVIAGAFTLPLAVSSQAEDAKVPFSKGTKLEVMIGRPSKIKGGDFDDKTQVLKPRFKFTNLHPQQQYSDYKGVFVMLGQSTVDTKVVKVLAKEDFGISILPSQVFEHELADVTTMYDTTGAKFGFKYDGWAMVVLDPKGAVVHVKSTSPALEKMATELQKMQLDQCYNKQLRPVAEPRLRF